MPKPYPGSSARTARPSRQPCPTDDSSSFAPVTDATHVLGGTHAEPERSWTYRGLQAAIHAWLTISPNLGPSRSGTSGPDGHPR
jgi:hypothetical protein